MCYQVLQLDHAVHLDGRRITPLPANHTVPAIGYQLDSGQTSLVFTGDTTTNDALWTLINRIGNLKYLIIESAFCNRKSDIAIRSKHLCPSLLVEELEKFDRAAEVYITHLKPGEADVTMREIQQCIRKYHPRRLENNQLFEF